MKHLIFSLMIIANSVAFANYNCTTTDGDVVKVSSSFRGTGATVESKSVVDFYKQSLKMDVERFTSIIDPETKKYVTETTKKGWLFSLQSENAQIGNMWSLEMAFLNATKAEGVLRDTESNEFVFDLTCTLVGGLE